MESNAQTRRDIDTDLRDAGLADEAARNRKPHHGHPMAHSDVDDTSTERTDARDAADAPDRHMGKNWPGDTPPDEEFRHNPPTRGGETGQDANDAF